MNPGDRGRDHGHGSYSPRPGFGSFSSDQSSATTLSDQPRIQVNTLTDPSVSFAQTRQFPSNQRSRKYPLHSQSSFPPIALQQSFTHNGPPPFSQLNFSPSAMQAYQPQMPFAQGYPSIPPYAAPTLEPNFRYNVENSARFSQGGRLAYQQPNPSQPEFLVPQPQARPPGPGGLRGTNQNIQRRNPRFSPWNQALAPAIEVFERQGIYLDQIASRELALAKILDEEMKSKDQFRKDLERLCRRAFRDAYPESKASLNLVTYGSVASGFGMKGSDIDIALLWDGVPPTLRRDAVPRLLEGELLKSGYGARLLTNTRVPILKVCDAPGPRLLFELKDARSSWEKENDISAEARGGAEFAKPRRSNSSVEDSTSAIRRAYRNARSLADSGARDLPTACDMFLKEMEPELSKELSESYAVKGKPAFRQTLEDYFQTAMSIAEAKMPEESLEESPEESPQKSRTGGTGRLEFPSGQVGNQCDINFSSDTLALHNTRLLRCYSACDPRVRQMVVFVKAWAKRRLINSAYHGTLSSYGYVLMVLHFLMNVVNPPVVPNLQIDFNAQKLPKFIEGYNVSFSGDEAQLTYLASNNRLTQNTSPLGSLLRNFFQYYAYQGVDVVNGGFQWVRDVISIRNRGGIISKASKKWTESTVTVKNNVEVKNRYLFAIEDPFETDHNVARTVVHPGIVAIRDEFRRAWRIIDNIGAGRPESQDLFNHPDERLRASRLRDRRSVGGLEADVPRGKPTGLQKREEGLARTMEENGKLDGLDTPLKSNEG